ncbi:Uncharacterized MFS-type transporter C409.08 [Serendipita indica DSM 11827]|nr:Uncharacterized MFS-type transporter C409.08 [Serendipita indica DSM 11827]
MDANSHATGASSSSQETPETMPVRTHHSEELDEKLAMYLEEKRQNSTSSQPSASEKASPQSVIALPERSNSCGSNNGSVASPPAQPYRGQGTKEDPYIVDWDADDPADPYNWSRSRRWLLTGQLAFGTLCITLGSSSYSGAIPRAKKELHMTNAVAILPISVYVFGFALGPLVFAPLSELYGRRRIFLCSFLPFFLFQIPCALAPNQYVLVVFRFLAGVFGSSPLSNGAGALADIWPASQRGVAASIYSSGPWFGPIMGPMVGGFLIRTPPGWRMVFWIIFMIAAIPSFLGIFYMPETYAPVLLRRRAQKLYEESARTVHYVSKYDTGRRETPMQKISSNMRRPFVFLFTEPIVALFSLWVGVLYGSLYATFIAFPFVFQRERHWYAWQTGLTFLGMGVGVIFGNILAPFNNKLYNRIAAKQPNGKASPEERLLQGMLGGVLVPIGLFWFAWSTHPNVHFMVPILSGIPFGMGTLMVFAAVVAYLMDTYQTFTASAIAATVVLRSILGALFPLFTSGLFVRIGTQWGASVFAFLALACMPLPFIFYFFGHRIRMNSRIARQFAIAQLQQQQRATNRSKQPSRNPSLRNPSQV